MPDAPQPLKIDFEEMQLALEDFLSAEIEHFLDTETGEIIPLHDDFDDAEEIRERIKTDLGERYRSLGLAAFRSAKSFSPLPKRLESKRALLSALSRYCAPGWPLARSAAFAAIL